MLAALCLPGSWTLFLELISLWECAYDLKTARMEDCLQPEQAPAV